MFLSGFLEFLELEETLADFFRKLISEWHVVSCLRGCCNSRAYEGLSGLSE